MSIRFYEHYVSLALFLLIVCGFSADAQAEDRILAVVNNEYILSSDYNRYLLKENIRASGRGVEKAVLNKVIEDQLILQEARKKGISVADSEVDYSIEVFKKEHKLSAEEFEKTITAKGMTVAQYKSWLKENILLITKMLVSEVENKVAVSDEEISGYYAGNRSLFVQEPLKLKIGAVVIRFSENPSPEEVTDIKLKSLKVVAEAGRGVPFEKLVEQYSGNPSSGNWILGEFEEKELNPAFASALKGRKESAVSDPLWMPDGVYILKIVKVSPEVILPFEKVKATLRTELIKQKKESIFKNWIKSLWEKASVTIP